MRKIESMVVNDEKITLKELTVSDVRAMMLARPEQDTVGYLLFDDISLADLRAMTDASEALFDSFTPSELDAVRLKAKAVNPHFFALMGRLKNLM